MSLAASEKCHQEKRKTVNGEDILFAMTSLGFENYAEALKIYLAKYREVSSTLFPRLVATTFCIMSVMISCTVPFHPLIAGFGRHNLHVERTSQIDLEVRALGQQQMYQLVPRQTLHHPLSLVVQTYPVISLGVSPKHLSMILLPTAIFTPHPSRLATMGPPERGTSSVRPCPMVTGKPSAVIMIQFWCTSKECITTGKPRCCGFYIVGKPGVRGQVSMR